jgi:hypothetical protein
MNTEKEIEQKHWNMVRQLAKGAGLIRRELTDQKIELMHMALGLAGEVNELDIENKFCYLNDILSEAGDVEFYLQGIRQVLNIDYVSPVSLTIECDDTPMNKVRHKCLALVDEIKKFAICNNQKAFQNCYDLMREIDILLFAFYDEVGLRREAVLRANLEKLALRCGRDYKYSDDAFINKKDQK